MKTKIPKKDKERNIIRNQSKKEGEKISLTDTGRVIMQIKILQKISMELGKTTNLQDLTGKEIKGEKDKNMIVEKVEEDMEIEIIEREEVTVKIEGSKEEERINLK